MNTSTKKKVEINMHLSGMMLFVVTILTLLGIFHVIAAAVAFLQPDLYLITENQLLIFNFTFWGWAHLLFGILLIVAAVGIFARKSWAMLMAIILASLSAIANFGFISVHPLWSIVMLIFDIAVIFTLAQRLTAEE